jgi:hypothetical protein
MRRNPLAACICLLVRFFYLVVNLPQILLSDNVAATFHRAPGTDALRCYRRTTIIMETMRFGCSMQ